MSYSTIKKTMRLFPHFASTASGWNLHGRNRDRLLVALTISLLIHGLFVSLQFGIPGLGLPGFELPWNKRRSAELSVRLTHVTRAPAVAAENLVPRKPAPTAPRALPKRTQAVPRLAVKPPLAVPPSVAMPAPLPPVSKASRPAPAVDRVRPAAPIALPGRRPATPNRPVRRKPGPASLQSKVIALAATGVDEFVLPPAAGTQAPETPKPETPKPDTPPRMPPAAPTKPAEAPSIQDGEQLALAQQHAARRAEIIEASQKEKADAERLALAAQVDLIAQQHAQQNAAAALQQEAQALQMAMQRRAEEDSRREQEALQLKQGQEEARAQGRALELAAIKRAQEVAQQEALVLQEQQKEREQKEREQLQVAQRLEEAARQLAVALARQKEEMEELAAKVRAQELAQRQQAEILAQQQREIQQREIQQREAQQREAQQRERSAAENLAPETSRGTRRLEESASLPRSLASGGDLASRSLDQARKLDLRQLEPLARPADQAAENSRRHSVFGSFDKDVGLDLYIESWRLKIERNGRFNYTQASSDNARGDPVVTVAVRSDGSVEDVIINRSSGRADLDQAVRRIVKLNTRYSAFPPALARRYDVIEIRRIWNFDDAVRLVEEVR